MALTAQQIKDLNEISPGAYAVGLGTVLATVESTANSAAHVDPKDSVKAASTAPLTLSGAQTVDGVALVAGDRILVKDQAAAQDNGIYVVAAGAWTRATDFDASAEVTPNAYVWVEQGTVNGDTAWVLTNNTAIVVGTTELTFTQFSGLGQITAGDGLAKTGSTLSVNVDNATIELNADALRVKGDGITGVQIHDDAVDSEHLVAGSIDTEHIAANQVTGAKIPENALGEIEQVAVSLDHAAASPFTLLAADANVDRLVWVRAVATEAAAGEPDIDVGSETTDTNGIVDDFGAGVWAVGDRFEGIIILPKTETLKATIAAAGTAGAFNCYITAVTVTVQRNQLAADVIDGTKLADDSVDSEHLVAGGIDTEHLADGVLSADVAGRAKMAADFLQNSHIPDGTIGSAKLADPYVVTPAKKAINVLRVASATQDGETITVGADVYEVDTQTVETITPGRIRLNLSGGSTVASQGTLTVDTNPTDGDTFTIGTRTYRLKDIIAQIDDINIEGTLGETQANIVACLNHTGTEGVDYFTGSVINANVSAAAFAGNNCVLTAKVPGTVGNSIATTETFIAGTNVFDAATLGTTTAGVDPTAGESSDAFIAAVNASGTEPITAIDISANEVLLVADTAGAVTTACTETLAGANNGFAAAAMYGGEAAAVKNFFMASRAPTAVEEATGNMHFVCNFVPTLAMATVRVTSDGDAKAWAGKLTIDAGTRRITLDNDGGTDFAATDTITVLALS